MKPPLVLDHGTVAAKIDLLSFITSMARGGVRELKAHLSQYLSRVKKGESVFITDHGDTNCRLDSAG
jgi:hypothetical protein